MNNIELNQKQREAYSLMETGHNIFITGMGGVGKSLLIKLFTERYKTKMKIATTSTTGTSAILIGGTTLHSYLGIKLGKGSVQDLINGMSRKAVDNWKKLDVLIIDEVSMLSPILFDKIEKIARILRKNESPFGGIQLILSGDFLQLPCVDSNNFCFEAKSWGSCITHTIYLTEIVRQEDVEFQNCLNEVRFANLSEQSIQLLKSCNDRKLDSTQASLSGIKPTRLFSTNDDVNYINEQEFQKISVGKQIYTYNIRIKNKKYEIAESYIKKQCRVESEISLCVGAQVMLLINLDVSSGLANGSRGIIVGFTDTSIPIVSFLTGITQEIDFNSWDITNGEEIVATISQIPLKLAWALSIHKAQGSTLDYAKIYLNNIFENGQAYVALSRIKNIEGLSLRGLNINKIKAHPKALEYYKNLK